MTTTSDSKQPDFIIAIGNPDEYREALALIEQIFPSVRWPGGRPLSEGFAYEDTRVLRIRAYEDIYEYLTRLTCEWHQAPGIHLTLQDLRTLAASDPPAEWAPKAGERVFLTVHWHGAGLVDCDLARPGVHVYEKKRRGIKDGAMRWWIPTYFLRPLPQVQQETAPVGQRQEYTLAPGDIVEIRDIPIGTRVEGDKKIGNYYEFSKDMQAHVGEQLVVEHLWSDPNFCRLKGLLHAWHCSWLKLVQEVPPTWKTPFPEGWVPAVGEEVWLVGLSDEKTGWWQERLGFTARIDLQEMVGKKYRMRVPLDEDGDAYLLGDDDGCLKISFSHRALRPVRMATSPVATTSPPENWDSREISVQSADSIYKVVAQGERCPCCATYDWKRPLDWKCPACGGSQPENRFLKPIQQPPCTHLRLRTVKHEQVTQRLNASGRQIIHREYAYGCLDCGTELKALPRDCIPREVHCPDGQVRIKLHPTDRRRAHRTAADKV